MLYKTEPESSSISTSSLLTTKQHLQVKEFLTHLNNEDLVNVGLELGLRYHKLKRMKEPLNEIVDAWLRMDDYVLEESGEPSWESLSLTLKKCGHTGIARNIRKAKGMSKFVCSLPVC